MALRKGRVKRAVRVAPLLLAAAATVLMVASCGGSSPESSSTQGSTKLPPGATASQESTASASDTAQAETQNQQQTTSQSTTQNSTTPMASADLGGARFTVVSATRPSSNEVVASSNERQHNGDYLQVELTIQNVGDDLVDLSDFSFRLYSPGITASQYDDYYGTTGTYGAYVSKHVISSTLLDLSTLQPVSLKLKVGETLEDVFLFFDLNPLSTAKNSSVTKENTNLIVYDAESGDKVEISLAGYPD